MQCKLKLCTQKYCIGSQKLRPRSWMWLCILIFQNTTSSKPACVFFGCFFLSVYICLFHQLQLHFSCKHTRAREDGDVKLCLTNILLRRHLILISRPRVPGATEVYFKAEHHIEIFSTRLTLTCRANSLWISVCFWVCVRGLRSWCICEYKTVILSVHSQAINSMITHQSGCCVWLHNHRSKSHSHSAPSYQRGYYFNPLFIWFWARTHSLWCRAGWHICKGALNESR